MPDPIATDTAAPLVLPDFAAVQRAAARLQGIATRTPVMTSRTADEATGARLFFKCENLQRMGAFKFRGAYNAIASLPDGVRQRGVIAFSSGNHAQGMALAGRLLGVPVEDEPKFSWASELLAQGLDPFFAFTGQAQGFEERLEAGLWLRGYLRDLLAQRREHPRDDLMSGLIAVEETGDQLTEDEILATCNLLLIAGHETTVNLIANAILAMLRHPDYWAQLAGDPARASVIVEETLRYDPPVQLVGRVAGADMTIGGVRVPKGDNMMLMLAAANRDPAVNERPDTFDPDRQPLRHLAFGLGAHFCLGAPLARLEAAVALCAVTKRFPGARLAGEPTYKPHVTLRGMARLDVAV
jgi:cytochrome P450